ncbi:MAG TPA: hypothetical protein PKZ99_06935, partial [Azospirillaceae bacterium]|nr:hypothetical protein [Azospirillaceae bacterium]
TAAPTDDVRAWGEARNRLTVARLICQSALSREESRGAHYRTDFPQSAVQPRRRMARLNGHSLDEQPVFDQTAAAAAGEPACRTH